VGKWPVEKKVNLGNGVKGGKSKVKIGNGRKRPGRSDEEFARYFAAIFESSLRH
jgi:hypothetical protein